MVLPLLYLLDKPPVNDRSRALGRWDAPASAVRFSKIWDLRLAVNLGFSVKILSGDFAVAGAGAVESFAGAVGDEDVAGDEGGVESFAGAVDGEVESWAGEVDGVL